MEIAGKGLFIIIPTTSSRVAAQYLMFSVGDL